MNRRVVSIPVAGERRPAGEGRERLTVIVPVRDEAACIGPFHDELRRTLACVDIDWELIYIDDGSGDGTTDCLRALAESEPGVVLVELTRTFGKERALLAGMDHAAGSAVVLIDGDGQDPPALIPEMVRAWREGAEVVHARRRSRSESRFRRVTAHVFYRLVARLSDPALEPDVGDFCLLDRRALDAVRGLRERRRYTKGLVSWVGFRATRLDYHRRARAAGASKWRPRDLARLAADALVYHGRMPFGAFALAGGAAGIAGIGLLGWGGVQSLLADATAWPLLILGAVGLLGGLQLVGLAWVGVYAARAFEESRDRPLYLVREVHRGTGEKDAAERHTP